MDQRQRDAQRIMLSIRRLEQLRSRLRDSPELAAQLERSIGTLRRLLDVERRFLAERDPTGPQSPHDRDD
jgi:hypothetical protein